MGLKSKMNIPISTTGASAGVGDVYSSSGGKSKRAVRLVLTAFFLFHILEERLRRLLRESIIQYGTLL